MVASPAHLKVGSRLWNVAGWMILEYIAYEFLNRLQTRLRDRQLRNYLKRRFAVLTTQESLGNLASKFGPSRR